MTLCAGEEETPSLVEKLRSGFRPGDRERRWQCTRLGVLWAPAFACRCAFGGLVQDGDRKSPGAWPLSALVAGQRGLGVALCLSIPRDKSTCLLGSLHPSCPHSFTYRIYISALLSYLLGK